MKDYNKIVEKFNILLPNKDSKTPFALFGFECNTGWYNIIYNAFAVICSDWFHLKSRLNTVEYNINNLEEHIDFVKKYSNSPESITREKVLKELETERHHLSSQLENDLSQLPKVAQVKEKFGTLRLYLDNCDDTHNSITDYAELMSAVTCELCGNTGKTYHMGWHKTLCKEHAIEKYGQDAVNNYESKFQAAEEITELGEQQDNELI